MPAKPISPFAIPEYPPGVLVMNIDGSERDPVRAEVRQIRGLRRGQPDRYIVVPVNAQGYRIQRQDDVVTTDREVAREAMHALDDELQDWMHAKGVTPA